LKATVDVDVVGTRGQPRILFVREAEAPTPFVVGGYVRDRTGLIGQRIEVRLQLFQAKAHVNRFGVADHVEIVHAGVNDATSVFVGDVGFAEIPLVRHRPVKNPSAARYRGDAKPRKKLLQVPEGLSNALARQAAVEWKKVPHPCPHAVSQRRIIGFI
jgi:hypothetical protein